MLFWILLALLMCLLLYHTVEDLYLLYIYRVPPGPISLPLIGSMYALDPYKPHVKLQSLIPKYGDIMSFRFGTSGQRSIIIHNTKIVEKICNNLQALDRPDMPYFELITPDGAGIGSRPYDKVWMFHTRIIKQALSKVCQNTLSSKVSETLTILFERFNQNGQAPQDIQHDLKLASLHVIFAVCYGIHFTDWTNNDMQELLQDHDAAMEGISPFHPVNVFPFLKHLPIRLIKKIKGITKRRDDLHQRIFNEHVQNYTGEIHDIMDKIVEVMETTNHRDSFHDPKKQQMELKNLFMSMTCLLMAGQDNLQSILLWSVLILASNSQIVDKMYKELEKTVSMDKMITTEMKVHLPYTEACVHEILRVSSSTPLGVPHFNKEVINVDGYKIPKGTQIFTNIWHIHNSDLHWKDSEQVIPERFLDEDGNIRMKHDQIYEHFLPFGRGKRTCTGAVLVEDVIFLFISNLVRTQTFRTSEYVPILVGNAAMAHKPPPFQVIFTPRQICDTAYQAY